MASKFRMKPVIVDAVQFDGTLDSELRVRTELRVDAILHFTRWGPILVVPTDGGELYVSPGFWVVRGVDGDIYTYKAEVFDETFEAVE